MNDAYNITQFTLLKGVMLNEGMCLCVYCIKHYNNIPASLLNYFQLNHVKIFSGHNKDTHH